MTNEMRQEISKVIIKVLKSKFDTFPIDAAQPRNAPFHKAFLQAFSEKFNQVGMNVDVMISMSSWMHGLNTTMGQTFFESVAHILTNGAKRSFRGDKFKIYSDQESIISEIMTDLKNGDKIPNMINEDKLISGNANGKLVTGTNFTADCYIEDSTNIIAIELKSVRPNSGETRGEKQKILKAKAALRNQYPNKKIQYFFGFPFDPTFDTDTGYNKKRFMANMVEFSKFCDEEEILLADELWSFLSGEQDTMQEILNLIKSIATTDFFSKFEFINNSQNLIKYTEKYIDIVSSWYLFDEISIAQNVSEFLHNKNRKVQSALFSCPFFENGKYNENRVKVLSKC